MKKSKFLSAVAIACTIIASLVATSACYWFFYQPKEPDCLKNK